MTPDLIDAARQRMRAMSIPESLIRQSEKAGTAQARFTLDAPVGGVVAELGVREGAAVSPAAYRRELVRGDTPAAVASATSATARSMTESSSDSRVGKWA